MPCHMLQKCQAALNGFVVSCSIWLKARFKKYKENFKAVYFSDFEEEISEEGPEVHLFLDEVDETQA